LHACYGGGDPMSIGYEPRDAAVVLVVDDKPVRKLIENILRKDAHIVLHADTMLSALATSRTFPTRIDLLVADIDLIGESGTEVVERILAERSEIRLLLTSSDGTSCWFPVLSKPFTQEQLRGKVFEVLKGPMSARNTGDFHPAA
jgi:CheY-like chemotaxis protein